MKEKLRAIHDAINANSAGLDRVTAALVNPELKAKLAAFEAAVTK